MSKLIYVDKLKKDILALQDCYNGFSDTYDKACIIGVIDEQPTIEERKWIPCSERLPEDGQFVLVCNDDRKMMIAKYESEVPQWEYKYTTYDWDVWDDQEHGPVMAWMPLPEPYKEGNT